MRKKLKKVSNENITTTASVLAVAETSDKIENFATGNIPDSTAISTSNSVFIDLVGEDVFEIEKFQFGCKDEITGYTGMVVPYKVTIKNTANKALAFVFTDKLDSRLQYVADSFMVKGVAVTPTITGKTLIYTIDSIAPSGGYAYVEFSATII